MFQPKTFRGLIKPLHLLNLLAGMGCFEYSGEKRAWKLAEVAYTIGYAVLVGYAGYHIHWQLAVYCILTKEPTIWFLSSFRLSTCLSILLIIVTRLKIKVRFLPFQLLLAHFVEFW